MRIWSLGAVALLAPVLAACATPQAMSVDASAVAAPTSKYRNAMAVRSVTGGEAMNILTMPGVANEPFKQALVSSLITNGYSASGAPKYYIDAEIQNLEQPLIGLDFDVVANVTYKISGGGTTASYPIKAKGTAQFSDSLIAADRIRVANERAMKENIKQFLQALK